MVEYFSSNRRGREEGEEREGEKSTRQERSGEEESKERSIA